MNTKTTILTGILFFSVAALVYSPMGEAFAKKIYIVNNLDVPLEFKEVQNRQAIQITSSPPDKINAGTTGTFGIETGDSGKNQHLNIKYYVNNSSTGEEIGIVYKWKDGETTKPHCPADHPDDIIEEVKHCGSWDNNNEWEYIFSPK